MAHVGTSMDLAKQPAKTGSSGQFGLWRALIIAIVVVAIGVGIVMAASFIAKSTTGVSAEDRSYDKIEAVRGTTTLSLAPVDLSYNSLRGVRNAPAPAAGSAPADLSYNSLQGIRNAPVAPLPARSPKLSDGPRER
jgi:hypothetical protein